MMELSHSLTLNEEAYKQFPEIKRPIFIFEWLRYLDKVLEAAQKSDLRGCQKQLVGQLVNQMTEAPGPPTRKLLARCLATVFSVGDTFLLFDTINKCNDILKNKDDSPSYLPTRLSAVVCIGAMYEKLGRMMGRSYEETVQILTKTLKSAESQLRIDIMLTLQKVVAGMGTAAANVHKDVYKSTKLGLTDRSLPVRSASAVCLLELIKHAPFLYTSETETLSQLCFRAFDNSTYSVRFWVAKVLGTLLATAQHPPKEVIRVTSKGTIKMPTLDEVLNILSSGFLRGGSSFLKGTGEMIKGSSSVSREVRVGITQAYVVFVQHMGALWLERNVGVLLNHLCELISNPKAVSTHVESVYSRKCVTFILRSTLGKMLGEKSQSAACKDITQLIIKQMNTIDASGDSGNNINDTSQHVLICLLQELGCLILSLGTTCSSLILDTHLNLIDAVASVLLHPNIATRLSAAWCLRCICLALPSQLYPLISRSSDRLETLKSSPEAISGYSFVISALVGCVKDTPLGIPHKTGKELFNLSEEFLRTASQNPRLSLHRATAGWLIIGSIMTLGVGVVKGLLPRMLLLWKNSFPRSSKELENEKARGDAFTWQVTFEGRAGALASIHSFLLFCPELAADDTIRRLLLPIEAAILMLSSLVSIIKQYGQPLKASAAMVRLRLYEVLSLLPQQSFESHYTSVLKLLVGEFTLAESASNTTTSLLRTYCHPDDSVILGSWLHETDHSYIEEQLQSNSASGSGALEHDACYLYRPICNNGSPPGPLPLGVAVIDASLNLFGRMFPQVANKHRLKMLNLFGEMIRTGKNQRQEAVQTNIFTAVLSALKGLSDSKTSLGQEDVKKAAVDLVVGGLTHQNPMLRCASGEAIGRMAQVVGDSRFVAEMAQNSFDKLRSSRDAVSRTGHSLGLGCLHRYVGGMGSGQHLNTSISILLALAKDTSSPIVQVWALHALSLIADSGGPMFRSYVEPSLTLMLELLLTVPPHAVEVHQCIGKCLQALITTVGPELQGSNSSIVSARWSLLCGCALVHEHYDANVQAEAITCLQQMHMFAPRHVNLSTLVPTLVKTLSSSHLLLRRAAVSCLRQLSQREAREVCDHALTYTQNCEDSLIGFVRSETGLLGIFFGLLDSETDLSLIRHVHHAVTHILQTLAVSQLSLWLILCREVLTSATDSGESTDADNLADNDDDMAQIHASSEPDPHPAIPPRWKTKVFAATCVAKIVAECETDPAHFDLVLARQKMAMNSKCDFLVLHLSEMIRMGFMAATSDSDHLRLEGLDILNLIIEKFAKSIEPEFPGHVVLEQYQAQVGAALRPAFASDTASHVTAKACKVCSAWIGSGVARDLNDLRRVHQLLVSSLGKLNKGSAKGLYNESATTLEKLAILKAWAEVYVVAVKKASLDDFPSLQDGSTVSSSGEKNLLNLVTPELDPLSRYWLAALKDHALLSLPPEFASQLPHDGGAFYSTETAEISKGYYLQSWPPMILAASLLLRASGFDRAEEELKNVENETSSTFEGKLAALTIGKKSNDNQEKTTPEQLNLDRLYLIIGLCFEWLCGPNHCEDEERTLICLKAIETLLTADFAINTIGANDALATEIATLMHRQILSSENINVHLSAIAVTRLLMKAVQKYLEEEKKKKHKDEKPANQECNGCDADYLGEGGETGEINTSQSLVYTALQIGFCGLVRHIPDIAPQAVASAPSVFSHVKMHSDRETIEKIISNILSLLSSLPNLCSPAGGVAILPSVLYLMVGILRECGSEGKLYFGNNGFLTVVLDALSSVSQHSFARDPRSAKHWCSLLQSALASVIDMSKCSEDRKGCDETIILRAIAQLILHAPPNVGRPHNIQYPAINMFKLASQHPDIKIRLKCTETLENIFSHPDHLVSTPYIHALAPRILDFLTEANKTVDSEYEQELIIESIKTVQLLIPRTLPQFRGDLVSVIVEILIGTLQDSNRLTTANKYETHLHEYSLNRLQLIGPEYPQEFRCVLTSKPELKLRLENAIRHQQETQRKDKTEPASATVPHKPTIKLKTDFSNFV